MPRPLWDEIIITIPKLQWLNRSSLAFGKLCICSNFQGFFNFNKFQVISMKFNDIFHNFEAGINLNDFPRTFFKQL